MKKCPKCGAENPDQMRFCTVDQTPLDGQEAATASADVVFCFDTTGSMQPDIDFLRKNALKFADDLNEAKVNYRLALIEFRDLKIGEPINVVVPFTESSSEFYNGVQALTATGGGDIPESSLDAIWTALELEGYRGGKIRPYIVLITDAPPHDPDNSGRSLDDLIQRILQAGARIMLVAPKAPAWEKMKSNLGTKAEHIPISAGERHDFQIILDRIVKGTAVVAV